MKLEVVVVPVADVDRAKDFYQALRWRLDADFVTGRISGWIRMNPPGSGCATISAPGSPRPIYDIDGGQQLTPASSG
jgi:catechol 2,3-dioxygenase-like lactoylglutathione lyase family enzyme